MHRVTISNATFERMSRAANQGLGFAPNEYVMNPDGTVTIWLSDRNYQRLQTLDYDTDRAITIVLDALDNHHHRRMQH